MTKFEHRSRFEEPEEVPFSIIAYEYNNYPISTLDLEKEYYFIASEDEYVAKQRFRRYIADKLMNDDPIVDYILDVLKDKMIADGTLHELNVHDIMERLK